MAEVAVAAPPSVLKRVARSSSPLRFSEIPVAALTSHSAGNRYDVVGGGVLYAATTKYTCYCETLARYRPTNAMRALLEPFDEDERHFMAVGGVPRDWRLQRRVYNLRLNDPLPFVDVENEGTLTVLERELAPILAAFGYADNLDLSLLRNGDRRLTRAIAYWAYAELNQEQPVYAGIRYMSRLVPDGECWAIFDGADIEIIDDETIELPDADLDKLTSHWDIRIF